MIPRLVGGFRWGPVASDTPSDATPTTVASGVAALHLSDPEHPESQGTSAADMESERQKLRPRRQVNRPTALGTDFRFTKINSSTMEPRPQFGHEAQGANGGHLVNVMVPQKDVHSAKDKSSADATKADTFFFTDVEDYHSGGIVLPATPPSDGDTGGNEAESTSQSAVAQKNGSAQLKRQVSNVVEERDKIVSELFKQKENFEHAVADLKKQRDELSGENGTLKIALDELRSKLDVSETSMQHLASEHERLGGLLSHAHRISAQHQLDSETLQITIVTLKEENSTILRDRDAMIEELKAQCDELNKKFVSLNTTNLEETQRADKNKEDKERLSMKLTESESLVKKLESEKAELAKSLERTKEEHEKGIQTLKAKYYDDMDDQKSNVKAMEKKNADLEKEIQKLKASLKDQETRRAEERSTESEETAVESEVPETPDKSKSRAVLGKRRMDDSDSAEPQEKKSRHGHYGHGAESTRGRPGFRDRVIGRFLGKSHSRPRTPEVDGVRNGKKTEERSNTKGTPGSVEKSADDVFSPFGLRKTSGEAMLTPLPGSIAPSTSTASTSTSNNADDEASAFGDDGIKSSPIGVGGTPTIAITTVDDEKGYLFVKVDSASTVFDSSESARKNGSKWAPSKTRSVSRERPPHLKLGEEPLSPTPVGHRRSRSPFSPLRSRPVLAPHHAATDPPKSHDRARSQPPSNPRSATAPVFQSMSQSKKRKQAEPDVEQVPVIKSWYPYDESDGQRQAKKNRT